MYPGHRKAVCHAKEGDTERVRCHGQRQMARLVKSEVRLFDEEEAISGSCELVPGGTQSAVPNVAK